MLRQAWQAMRDRFHGPAIGRGSVVEIFSKPDCPLCVEAKAHLMRLQVQWGFELREVNIAKEHTLLAQYGARIPLVWVNGRLACKYRVDEQALRQKLQMPRPQAGEEELELLPRGT